MGKKASLWLAAVVVAAGIAAVAGIFWYASADHSSRSFQAGAVPAVTAPSVVGSSNNTGNTPAVTNTTPSPATKYAFIYTKYDRSVDDAILLFDPTNGSPMTIKSDSGGAFLDNIGTELQQWQPLDGSPLRLISTEDVSATTTNIFFLGAPDWNGEEFPVIHADSSVIPQNIFIAPNMDRVVYCDANGQPTYFDITPSYDEQAVPNQNQLLCTSRSPVSGYWFSEDENTIYYPVVPTDETGSSTNGDFEQFRELDLTTGSDTPLTTPPGIFRDESNGWEKDLDAADDRALDIWNETDAASTTVIVRAVPSPDFNYFTMADMARWPVVAQFNDVGLREAIITEDGKGVFYINQVSSSQEFGYFDVTAGKNYFPLFSYPNAGATGTDLIGAYDKNNLLYTVEPAGSPGSQNIVLYDGSVSGQTSVADNSWRGFQLLYFVKKSF